MAPTYYLVKILSKTAWKWKEIGPRIRHYFSIENKARPSSFNLFFFFFFYFPFSLIHKGALPRSANVDHLQNVDHYHKFHLGVYCYCIFKYRIKPQQLNTSGVADPRGRRWRPPNPLTKIILISCIFWENPANLYVGVPPEGWRPLQWGILYPPLIRVITPNSLFTLQFEGAPGNSSLPSSQSLYPLHLCCSDTCSLPSEHWNFAEKNNFQFKIYVL